MTFLLWILGAVGHLGIWVTLFNQIHSTACPRSTRKLTEIGILIIATVPLGILGLLFLIGGLASLVPNTASLGDSVSLDRWLPLAGSWLNNLLVGYTMACILAGLILLFRWLYRKVVSDRPAAIMDQRREMRSVVNVIGKDKRPLFHGPFATALGCIPFNQVLKVGIERMTWSLDIANHFDGLKICHLSDFHFTGLIDQAYFQEVVEIANRFEPDLVLITGDLLDSEDCIEWIGPVFGRLESKLGNYFVLGNHDRRIKNIDRFLAEMKKHQLVHLRSVWVTIDHNGGQIALAGNELPWFSGAEKLPQLSDAAAPSFKILLSHSPDQMGWAKSHGFDLMLAGHTHGGQIVIPLIGPIVSPSRFGVKYAAGTFDMDSMLMHVSRGISGDKPIRINCPPEIGLITIRAGGS